MHCLLRFSSCSSPQLSLFWSYFLLHCNLMNTRKTKYIKRQSYQGKKIKRRKPSTGRYRQNHSLDAFKISTWNQICQIKGTNYICGCNLLGATSLCLFFFFFLLIHHIGCINYLGFQFRLSFSFNQYFKPRAWSKANRDQWKVSLASVECKHQNYIKKLIFTADALYGKQSIKYLKLQLFNNASIPL